jgi:3-hydroxyisobutyrate dehydrogenase-like beta-hydroxyacid dehydrogenase
VTDDREMALLGLGGMGGALARTAIDSGRRVTVWNRSPRRSEPFAERALVAVSAAEAIRAAPLSLLCVVDGEATKEVLTSVSGSLDGRVICSVATSTPAESRELSEFVVARGGRYLDGAIATYPARVGKPKTVVFWAGDREAYRESRDLLNEFGGASLFVGEDPGSAAAADLGFLSVLGGFTIGLLQAAAFCDAEGIDSKAFFDAVPGFSVEMEALAAEFGQMIPSRSYTGDQAELNLYPPAYQGLADAAQDSGVSAGFPNFMRDVFADAVDAGLGELQVAAVFERLRRASPQDE